LFDFLKSRAAVAATILLLVQATMLYSSGKAEAIPPAPPLSQLPLNLGAWGFVQDFAIDDETKDVLKADDLLLREYKDSATDKTGTLFVAAFRSQRNGKSPHSPKNCLPGSGWTQLHSDMYSIDAGNAEPIVVNRYVVQHDSEKDLVMYWYQSRERVIASEYTAKFWVMADAIHLNRTDTALVRVVVPIANNDVDAATLEAAGFVKSFFKPLRQILPA
jgi:EpsI family protein